ncbi:transcription factor HES-1-like [Gigantopelta aegis]|uniref:transcription factor HES-1-like n=1 Tax=Gigantopelta aegis TaxID=1735272 RepID=UPI001B88D865|nr:transcription factor HES-1-like [Gigantopelta aegis]
MHSDKVTTTASETRKSTKPIMEKKRRARINASLAELKTLLLEVIKKEGSRHSKMEKADILEMTVKHLRQIQRQHFTGSTDPTHHSKYQVGFNECVQEVSKYLTSQDICDVDIKARLLNHLANCITGFDSSGISSMSPTPISSPESTTFSPMTSPESTTSPIPFRSMEQSIITSHSSPVLLAPRIHTQTVNNNSATTATSSYNNNNNNVATAALPQQQPVQMAKLVSGLQVIPTKLPSGEIAFVLPANVVGGAQVPNYIIPMYTSPGSNFVSTSAVATVPAPQAQSLVTTSSSVAGTTIAPHYNNLQTCTVTALTENINLLPCSTVPPPGSGLTPTVLGLSSPGSGLSPPGSGLTPPGSGLPPHIILPSSTIPAISTMESSVFSLGHQPRFLLDNRIGDVLPMVPARPNVNNMHPVQNEGARGAAEEDDDAVWRPW